MLNIVNIFVNGVPNFLFFEDMEDLESFAKGHNAVEANQLRHWDINFWSERLRESRYDINEVDPFPLCSIRNQCECGWKLCIHLFVMSFFSTSSKAKWCSLLVFLAAGRTTCFFPTAKGYRRSF